MNNLLFFKPSNQLSFYFISKLLFDTKDLNQPITIYVVLPNSNLYSTSQLWYNYIKSFHLEHFFIQNYPNLTLINENDLNITPLLNDIKKNIKNIFFDLPYLPSNLSFKNYSKIFKKDISNLKKLKIPVYLGVIIDYTFENTVLNDFFENKIKKKLKESKIFYYGNYLGEEKRGILNQHRIIESFSNYINLCYYNKKVKNELDIKYFDDLDCLYGLFFNILKGDLEMVKNEIIFNNMTELKLYPDSFESTLEADFKDLEEYNIKLLESLYKIYINDNIQKISYNHSITLIPFIQKHDLLSNLKLLSHSSIDYKSGVLFITSSLLLILTLIIISFVYLYFPEYHKYIIFFSLVLFYKLQFITSNLQLLLNNFIQSFLANSSGNIIIDDTDSLSKFNKFIFLSSSPLSHHLFSSFKFKSLFKNEINIKNVIKNGGYVNMINGELNIIDEGEIEEEIEKNSTIGYGLKESDNEKINIFNTKENDKIFIISIIKKTPIVPVFTFELKDNKNKLTIVGLPIEPDQNSSEDDLDSLINEYKLKYSKEMIRMYKKYKPIYTDLDTNINII